MISGITENEWVFTNKGLIFASEIQTDMELLSYNFETKQTEYKKVLNVVKSNERHKLKKIMMSYVVQKSTVMFSTDYCFFRLSEDGVNVEKITYDLAKRGDRLLSLKTENSIFYPDMWHVQGTHRHFVYDIQLEDNAPFFAGKVTPILIQKQIN